MAKDREKLSKESQEIKVLEESPENIISLLESIDQTISSAEDIQATESALKIAQERIAENIKKSEQEHHVLKQKLREETEARVALEENLRAQEIKTLLEKFIDARTGILFTSEELNNHVEDIVKESVLSNTSVWVVETDFDGFKEVNDAFGQDIGDEVISAFAQAQTEVLRDSDLTIRESFMERGGKLAREDLSTRIGGDEFRVFLFDVDGNDIPNITKRIYERWRELLSEIEVKAVTAKLTKKGIDTKGDTPKRKPVTKGALTSRLTLSMGASQVRKTVEGDVEDVFGETSTSARANLLRDSAKGKGAKMFFPNFVSNLRAVGYGLGFNVSPDSVQMKNILLIKGREDTPYAIALKQVALISSRSPLHLFNNKIAERNKKAYL